jgi:hypothetical protein
MGQMVPATLRVNLLTSKRRERVTQQCVIETTMGEAARPVERRILQCTEAEYMGNLAQRVRWDKAKRGFSSVELNASLYGFQSFTSLVL